MYEYLDCTTLADRSAGDTQAGDNGAKLLVKSHSLWGPQC